MNDDPNSRSRTPPARRATMVVLVLCALAAGSAWAEGKRFTAADPEWQAECGSCHVAYPPALLSAPEWRRIMDSLSRHYGVDASLDPAAEARVGAFVARHARTRDDERRRRAGDGELPRITTSAWFVREHREVPAATWSLPAVLRGADCVACHPGAAQGDFSERDLRVPASGGSLR